MTARLRSWWQKIKQRWVAIAVTTAIIMAAIALIIIGDRLNVTGFNNTRAQWPNGWYRYQN
jgi:hypothetical protein